MILVTYEKGGKTMVKRCETYQEMIDFMEDNYHNIEEFKVRIFE